MLVERIIFILQLSYCVKLQNVYYVFRRDKINTLIHLASDLSFFNRITHDNSTNN
jgi:hypothetical protein